MRVFVTYDNERAAIEVPKGRTVSHLKHSVRRRFNINENRARLGDENQERPVLVLSFGGAELHDAWTLADLAIPTGSTLKAYIREEYDPLFHFEVVFEQETIAILDRLRIRDFSVIDLRRLVVQRTGLPVGVFRLLAPNGVEMFDCNQAEDYEIKPGDVMKVHVWDGMGEMLRLAKAGLTDELMSRLPNYFHVDEHFGNFCCRVALFIASHFGHADLATTLIRQTSAKPGESVGVHPHRSWCFGQWLARHRWKLKNRQRPEGSEIAKEAPGEAKDEAPFCLLPSSYGQSPVDGEETESFAPGNRGILQEDLLEMARKAELVQPHPDIYKAPIHEAVECNQLAVLRLFVHHSPTSIMACDGEGRQPLNIALRKQKKRCASFLLSKQWSRVAYKQTSLPLSLVAKMKQWADIGRERAVLNLRVLGKRKTVKRDCPLVGEAIYVDGYSPPEMTSGADLPAPRHLAQKQAIRIALELERKKSQEEAHLGINPQQSLTHISDPLIFFTQAAQLCKQLSRNSSFNSKAGNTLRGAKTLRSLGRHARLGEGQKSHHSDTSSTRQSPVFKGPLAFSPEQNNRMNEAVQKGQTALTKHQLPPIAEKNTKASRTEDNFDEKLKRRAILARLPVPAESQLLIKKYAAAAKPYYFTAPGQKNPVDEFMEKYEAQHRLIPSRSLAKHCLTLTSSFAQKPWLSQVHMATELVNSLVKKSKTRCADIT